MVGVRHSRPSLFWYNSQTARQFCAMFAYGRPENFHDNGTECQMGLLFVWTTCGDKWIKGGLAAGFRDNRKVSHVRNNPRPVLSTDYGSAPAPFLKNLQMVLATEARPVDRAQGRVMCSPRKALGCRTPTRSTALYESDPLWRQWVY